VGDLGLDCGRQGEESLSLVNYQNLLIHPVNILEHVLERKAP